MYAPLDQKFIDDNFERLKSVVARSPTGKHQSEAKSLMTQRRLEIRSSDWRLHTVAGANLTLQQLQAETRPHRLPVPNVAHYILPFKRPLLEFHHFVCILSGYWLMRPLKVVLWYAKPPTGRYWRLLLRNATGGGWLHRIVMIHRPAPTSVYSRTVAVPEHKADVMRIEAILAVGGAYFDLDVMTLRSLEPLRHFPFTIGKELNSVLCNGVFLGSANNTMLAMWHLTYQTLDDSMWGGHSLFLISAMCKEFAGMCHVEEESLNRPGWEQFDKIFGNDRSWDWRRRNYAMHLFYRLHAVQYNSFTIRSVDNMFGDMARFVLFGRTKPWPQTAH